MYAKKSGILSAIFLHMLFVLSSFCVNFDASLNIEIRFRPQELVILHHLFQTMNSRFVC